MNDPVLIFDDDFSKAWAKAILQLKKDAWKSWNYVITIKNPTIENKEAIDKLNVFCKKEGLLLPDTVQRTIFPKHFYIEKRMHNKEAFYRAYNHFYSITRDKKHSVWGTYFKRMISYQTKDGSEYDQLDSIIKRIKSIKSNYGSANFIVIPQVGVESNKIMGAPCLNYITVQVEKQQEKRVVSLLAVYRNHDYLKRTFGNYWGLCELLKYICIESGAELGTVTCISSHAYVEDNKTDLLKIANEIIGE